MREIAIIGLGKMGQNIALHLLEKDYSVFVYNRTAEKTKQIAKHGAIPCYSIDKLSEKMHSPKIIMLMLTAGQAIDDTIKNLMPVLGKNDIIIDGGNSYFKDSVRRYNFLKRKKIDFIDMGISGGIGGARHGASLMIGGGKKTFKKIEFLCKDLSVKNGYSYLGSSGAGHFAKMVHNAIEYAMLEAFGEGFEILEKSPYKYNYKDIARIWNNGSIIRSHIVELIGRIFTKNPNLKGIKGVIGGGETGLWAEEFAKSVKGDVESLRHAINKRKSSEKKQTISTKLLAALRQEFGGHKVEK